MSLLADLNTIAKQLDIAVETGLFSEPAPAEYLVLTPLYNCCNHNQMVL